MKLLAVTATLLLAVPAWAETPAHKRPSPEREVLQHDGHKLDNKMLSPNEIEAIKVALGEESSSEPLREGGRKHGGNHHNHHHHPQHHHHEPHKEIFDLVYTSSDSDHKPGSFVEVDEVVTYETIEPVWQAIYAIEYQLDELDKIIDKSPLDKCFDCRQESKLACCYKTYAEALIRLLVAISEKAEHLPGEVDKYLVTAINSIRAADYAFVYELARRMKCDEYIKEIMKKQGALDGTTSGSIREAFALIVTTPYITGDNFEGFTGQVHRGKKEEKKEKRGISDSDQETVKRAINEIDQGLEDVDLVLKGMRDIDGLALSEEEQLYLAKLRDLLLAVRQSLSDDHDLTLAEAVESLELSDLPTRTPVTAEELQEFKDGFKLGGKIAAQLLESEGYRKVRSMAMKGSDKME
ncbi:hypothetical protein CC79DRAFT_1364283 [Sarocladium strictum]